MRSVDEIIQACAPLLGGGRKGSAAAHIANQSEGKLTRWAVYKWPQSGIPQDHWDLVGRLSGATVPEIYEANQALARQRSGAAA